MLCMNGSTDASAVVQHCTAWSQTQALQGHAYHEQNQCHTPVFSAHCSAASRPTRWYGLNFTHTMAATAATVLQILPELPEHLWQKIALYLVPQCLDHLQQGLVQQLLFGESSLAVHIEHPAQLAALQECLDVVGVGRACMHMQPLRSLQVSTARSAQWHQPPAAAVRTSVGHLRLPIQQLAQLQSLSVDGLDCLQLQLGPTATAAAAAGRGVQQQPIRHNDTAAAKAALGQLHLGPSVLQAPLQLTSLKLHSCKLAAGQGWEVLAGLPQLQQLELVSVAPGDASATDTASKSPAAERVVFAGALASLQQLTSLKLQLSQRLNGSVIAAARHLSKLQQMNLHRVGTEECAVCLDDLPSSLTGLTAFGCYYCSRAAGGGSGSVCQLTALRALRLELCVGEATCLRRMLVGCCSLQRLEYVAAAGDDIDASLAQLLAAASGLADLQHLQLSVAGVCGGSKFQSQEAC